MREIDIIIPTYKSPLLVALAIKAYEKFTPNFKLNYIVVENSEDDANKDFITNLAESVTWVKNNRNFYNEASPADREHLDSYIVATAYEMGLSEGKSDMVFFSHNDVAPVNENWLDFLVSKIDNGFTVAGTMRNDWKIYAVHSCALLTTRDFANEVSLYPEYDVSKWGCTLDVGDNFSLVARRRGLNEFACKNTHNHKKYAETISEPFKSFQVCRSMNGDNDVIFLHLGRGTPKHFGRYTKNTSALLQDWVNFLHTHAGVSLSSEEANYILNSQSR